MTALTDTIVKRGGSTAKRWYQTVHSVGLMAADGLRITFSISGNKGGQTDIQMDIGPKDFPTLVEAMCLVDRQAAMEAMAVEISRQVQIQPERDRARAVSAMTDVQNLAADKYRKKPVGEDEQEKVVLNGVKTLVEELKAKEKDKT
jgi:hypothetical protein